MSFRVMDRRRISRYTEESAQESRGPATRSALAGRLQSTQGMKMNNVAEGPNLSSVHGRARSQGSSTNMDRSAGFLENHMWGHASYNTERTSAHKCALCAH